MLFFLQHIFKQEVVALNNNFNNVDMNKLLEMLSKMDKKQLEEGLKKANEIINKNKQ